MGGFFSGIAQGVLERKRRAREKEYRIENQQLGFLNWAAQKAAEENNPDAMAAVLRSIGDYHGAERKGGKKGQQERDTIFHKFADLIPSGRKEEVPFGTAEKKLTIQKPLFKTTKEKGREKLEAEKPELEYKAKLALEKTVETQSLIAERIERGIRLRNQFDEIKREQQHGYAVNGQVDKLIAAKIAASINPDTGVPELGYSEAKRLSGKQIEEQQALKTREMEDKHKTATANLADARIKLNDQLRRTDIYAKSQAYLNRKRELEPKISGANKDLADADRGIQTFRQDRVKAFALFGDDPQKLAATINEIDANLQSAYAQQENARRTLQEASDSLRQAAGTPPSQSTMPKEPPGIPKKDGGTDEAKLRKYADKYFGGNIERARTYAAAHP